jgi:hypothetical protein
MSKSSARLKQLSLDDEWMDHPFVQWLSLYKQMILFAFLAILAVILIAYRWTSHQTTRSEAEFFQAQSEFSKFQEQSSNKKNWETSLTPFSQLTSIMNSHPELQAKYDGPIAQTFLIEQDALQAQPFAERAFRRTASDHLNLYKDYAQTSLAITSGLYEDALTQAQQLKYKMDEELAQYGETLYIFNLVRLAILYQQLHRPQEELKTWELIQQYEDLDTLAMIYQLFRDGNVSLADYIEERKQTLQILEPVGKS